MQELLERREVEDLVADRLTAVDGVLLSDFLAFGGLLGAAGLDGEGGVSEESGDVVEWVGALRLWWGLLGRVPW